MAKPIEPTPPLTGKDAQAVLEALDKGASPDEMERRVAEAKKRLTAMTAPKGFAPKPAIRSNGATKH